MLYAYTLESQTINTNNNVIFNINGIRNSCAIRHEAGASIITITKPGTYTISVNLDATLATTGTSQFTLYNNGTAVGGAVATSTVATANDIDNYSFTAAIRVLPSCPAVINTAQLTVVNTGANAAIVSNAAITVREL